MGWLSILASAILSGFPLVAQAGELTISAEPNGTYQVRAQKLGWVFRGKVIKPQGLESVEGEDRLGAFHQIHFGPYSIKLYPLRDVVIFSVTSHHGEASTIRFPTFSEYPKGLREASFTHDAFSPIRFDLKGDAPWLFFDLRNPTGAFLLSPANHFMISNNFHEASNGISIGIEPQVREKSESITFTSILAVAPGINEVYENWGRALTDLAGKVRPKNDADNLLNGLGYWTDNRSSYWYNFDLSLGYEGTLKAVRKEFSDNGFPLAYMQLDSWWYLKGSQPPSWKKTGFQHGIYRYEAAPELFPHGLGGLGIPLITHSRWIDSSSPYTHQYKMSNQVSVDPDFWRSIMVYLHKNGVTTYEQDWLNEEATPRFDRVDDADHFMDEMASAAASQGINLQYCMALPRHFLQGSKYSNLHTIRTSGDGFDRGKWTAFLFTARLASALGIWPWTDVFFSEDRESILLATLSGGPVGVGDRLSLSSNDANPEWCGKELRCTGINKDNLKHSVRVDGEIIKPDTALVPLDTSYSDQKAMIAAAYSRRNDGEIEAAYVFAYSLDQNAQAPFALSPKDLGISGEAYFYSYFSGTGQYVGHGKSYVGIAGSRGTYLIVVPVVGKGIAVLGDLDHYVTLGRKRVRIEQINPQKLRVNITLALGEKQITIRGVASSRKPRLRIKNGKINSQNWDLLTKQFGVALTGAHDMTLEISP